MNEICEFIFAGNAIFTVVNTDTGNRMTFRFRKPRDRRDDDAAPLFAQVMNGTDNDRSYAFVGTIFDPHDDVKMTYRHSHKSRMSSESVASRAIAWLVSQVQKNTMPDTIEIWHEGKCGRCGKTLTVPESIENGLGPICIRVRGA